MKVVIYALVHLMSLLISSGAELRGSDTAILAAPHHNDQEHRSLMVGQIVSVALVNADADRKIQNLQNGTIIAMNGYLLAPNVNNATFNLNVTVNGTDIRSIRFGYSNSTTNITSFNVENVAPWAFCGNTGTDFNSCPQLGLGTHTITITPYYQKNARGPPGIPVTLTFTIVAQDRVRPELLNFALDPNPTTGVDVSAGPVRITGTVTVRDDASGILGASVDILWPFFPPSTYTHVVGIKSAFVGDGTDLGDSIPGIHGVAHTYQFSMVISQFAPPGVYPLRVLLYDVTGNLLNSRSSTLATRGFPSTVNIANSGNVDASPPSLVNFTSLTPLIVNVSTAPGTVEFEFVVSDDLSGFALGRFFHWCVSCGFNDFANKYANDLVYPAGINHTFRTQYVFKKGSALGNYSVNFALCDDIFNCIIYSPFLLQQRGFPSIVTVVA